MREPRDYYTTPISLARECVSVLVREYTRSSSRSPSNMLEPGCGQGPFLTAGLEWDMCGVGIDIEPQVEASDHIDVIGADYLGVESVRLSHDIVASNPPFSLAREFIEHTLVDGKFLSLNGVAGFLLQSGFLGSKKREDFFARHRPMAIYQIVPRPSFGRVGEARRGQTDAREYILAVWGADRVTETRYDWLRWHK